MIIDEMDKTREEKAAKLGFSAYAVTSKAEDDPLAKALQGMLDHSMEQDQRMEELRREIRLLREGTEDDRVVAERFNPGRLRHAGDK
jgi:serine O-acetyltransferase